MFGPDKTSGEHRVQSLNYACDLKYPELELTGFPVQCDSLLKLVGCETSTHFLFALLHLATEAISQPIITHRTTPPRRIR